MYNPIFLISLLFQLKVSSLFALLNPVACFHHLLFLLEVDDPIFMVKYQFCRFSFQFQAFFLAQRPRLFLALWPKLYLVQVFKTISQVNLSNLNLARRQTFIHTLPCSLVSYFLHHLINCFTHSFPRVYQNHFCYFQIVH